MASTSRGVGLVTKPPVFWVVDISRGRYEGTALPAEIGSEALLELVKAEAEKLVLGRENEEE